MASWRRVLVSALLAAAVVSSLPAVFGAQPADTRAPDRFRVRLDTTRGPIVVDCTRAWAPLGADRFYTLVTSGYYDDAALFRVVKGKWAQFGIASTPAIAQAWRARTIPDDPFVGQSNVKGTVAFAFATKNGRTTQVFFQTSGTFAC